MSVYLDVGVVRIQQYLGRWPALRGQRGASELLACATAADEVTPVLPGSCRVHDEAGQADGVVHLVVDDPSELHDTIGAVFGHLREQAPAAELHAAHGEGPTYVDAHPSMQAMLDRGQAERSLPAATELSVLQRCGLCWIDVAEGEVFDDDELKPACRDCIVRDGAADRGRSTAEQWLLDAIGASKRVSTFEELAALGPAVRGLRNHLATVKIDGNAIGAFFATLSEAGSGAKTRVSQAISQATRQALFDATIPLYENGMPLPVIPHFVGGDDMVVSVPAGWGWAFTRTFLAAFEREAGGVVAEAIEPEARRQLGDRRLSVSAGIAFARTRHPFVATSRLAEDALRRAKTSCPGRSAICWADRTRDGDELPDNRSALKLSDLEEAAEAFEQLASLDASRRHALEAATADVRTDPATAGGRLRRELRRLGVPHPAHAYLHDAGVGVAGDVLHLVRWWM